MNLTPEHDVRVLRFQGEGEKPDLTHRGGPMDGQYAAMPADCDVWIEPDGSVYL